MKRVAREKEPVGRPVRRTCVTTRVPRTAWLLAALLGAALAPFPQPSASASCSAPDLETDGLVLRPGAEVVVEGRGFLDGCQDSMGCTESLGCSSCEYDEPPPEPTADVALVLRQGGRTWQLGTVDADADGRVAWRFTVPRGLRHGTARLVPAEGVPARVPVT